AFMPVLRTTRGRIVFMGSIGGRAGTAMTGPYNASKFAIEGIAESFRQELAPWGMHVIVVEPGAIKTPIWEKGTAQVDELRERLPQAAQDLYKDHIDSVAKALVDQDNAGIAPVEVAKVVERALTVSRPRYRYLVGRDAKAGGTLSRVLPDRAKAMLMSRA